MPLLPGGVRGCCGGIQATGDLDRIAAVFICVDLTSLPSWNEQVSRFSLHVDGPRWEGELDPSHSGGANLFYRRDPGETRRPGLSAPRYDGIMDLRPGAAAAAAAQRWSSPELTYKYAPGFPDEAKAAVSRAFITWERPLNFTFSLSSSPSGTADVCVGMFDGNEDGELAHAYLPPHGIMNFNSRHPWWYGLAPPPKHRYDFQSVAVHEIGHLLGLGHSHDPNDIMYGFIDPGEVRRSLTRADAAELKCLYRFDSNFYCR